VGDRAFGNSVHLVIAYISGETSFDIAILHALRYIAIPTL
jgi:hypothetical protein